MSKAASASDGTEPEESGDAESGLPDIDYGDRWHCPACGNHSKVCYRCDSCGHDFADEQTTAAHYDLGEIEVAQ